MHRWARLGVTDPRGSVWPGAHPKALQLNIWEGVLRVARNQIIGLTKQRGKGNCSSKKNQIYSAGWAAERSANRKVQGSPSLSGRKEEAKKHPGETDGETQSTSYDARRRLAKNRGKAERPYLSKHAPAPVKITSREPRRRTYHRLVLDGRNRATIASRQKRR